VGCPACKAERGEQCRRLRGGPRESNHGERVKAAEAAVLERDWDRGEHGPDDRDLDRGELGARGTATQAGEPVEPRQSTIGAGGREPASCPYETDGFKCDREYLENEATNTARRCICRSRSGEVEHEKERVRHQAACVSARS